MPSHLQPIALRPVFAKIFANIAFKELSSYFEISHKWTDVQFGFRAERLCEAVVLDLMKGIRRAVDRGYICFAVFNNFSESFNSLFTNYILASKMDARLSKESALWMADASARRFFTAI